MHTYNDTLLGHEKDKMTPSAATVFFFLSCSVVSDSWHLYSLWNSSGQNTGVGSLSFLQGIFPTQGSNPGLPHCRWILYQLSHKGKPKNTGAGSLSLLQGIFPTQELNRGLHCSNTDGPKDDHRRWSRSDETKVV